MIKKLLSLLILAVPLWADTTTSRAGLVKPTIGGTAWGTKLNTNFDILDSSMCLLTGTNAMSGTYNFSGTPNLYHGTRLNFQDTTGSFSSQFWNNTSGALNITALASDGFEINTSLLGAGNARASGSSLLIGPSTTLSYGAFALVGSSQNAQTTYSGFIATAPVSQNVLWSLPVADGGSGQFLTTDGATHLSFSSLGNLQKNVQLNGSSGVPGTISSMTITAASAPSMGLSLQPSFLTSGSAAVITSSAGINFDTSNGSVKFLQNARATAGLTASTMTATGFDISTTSTSVTGSGGLRVAFGVTLATMTFSADSSTQTTSARAGRIVQSLEFTSASSSATTTTVFASTLLTGSITPASADNYIRVTVMGCIQDNNPAVGNAVASIFRGSTDLSVDASHAMCNLGDGGVAAGINVPCMMIKKDKPATTSSTTYTVKIRMETGSGTATWGNNCGQYLLLEEISQ